MSWIDLAVLALLGAGLAFYAAGSLGLLRFPDTASRLHALTKADNLGLGLVALAAAIYGGSLAVAAKIALVWLFAVIAAGTTSQLLARRARLDESTAKCGAIMQPFRFLTKISAPDAIARTWCAACHRAPELGFAA